MLISPRSVVSRAILTGLFTIFNELAKMIMEGKGLEMPNTHVYIALLGQIDDV